MEWLQYFHPTSGLSYLRALSPLLRSDPQIRDFAVKACHKLMFINSENARLLSVDAYFLLVDVPAKRSFSSYTSPITYSQRVDSSQLNPQDIDVEFFFRCRDTFKRALTYPLPVRIRVYAGLTRLFECYDLLRPTIFDLLSCHMRKYIMNRIDHGVVTRCPLHIDRTIDTSDMIPSIGEPLNVLISTIHHMLRVYKRDGGIIKRPKDVEFTPSELDEFDDSDERSISICELQMRQLRDRISRAHTLQELSVASQKVMEATMDDAIGVQAVLQAQVMHGVLLSMLDEMLEISQTPNDSNDDHNNSHDSANPSSSSSSSSHTTMNGIQCIEFIKLFDLFWDLHQLLTMNHTVKSKKHHSTKKSIPKKKKTNPDVSEDEEEDEEDEPEEDDDEDENADHTDDDNDEEEKKSASKSKSKLKSKSKSSRNRGRYDAPPLKLKSPPKAVTILCRSLNRSSKTHIPGWSVDSVLLLLAMSQLHNGDIVPTSSMTNRPILTVVKNTNGSSASSSTSTSSSSAPTEPPSDEPQRVGDVLLRHMNLRRFILTCMLDNVLSMINHSNDNNG